jgi:hypothetical protein
MATVDNIKFIIFLLQFALAGMYYGGLGVEQSFNRAFTLYKVRIKKCIICPNLAWIPSYIYSFSVVGSAGVCKELCPPSSQHAWGHVQIRTGSDGELRGSSQTLRNWSRTR